MDWLASLVPPILARLFSKNTNQNIIQQVILAADAGMPRDATEQLRSTAELIQQMKAPNTSQVVRFAPSEAWEMARRQYLLENQESIFLPVRKRVPTTRLLEIYLFLRAGLIQLGDAVFFDTETRKILRWKTQDESEETAEGVGLASDRQTDSET